MSGYRLKKDLPEFQVTREGPFEYHTFRHGEVYREIPPEEAQKFDVLESKGEEGGETE